MGRNGSAHCICGHIVLNARRHHSKKMCQIRGLGNTLTCNSSGSFGVARRRRWAHRAEACWMGAATGHK
eukprot:6104981-Amphidinium_carterae.1